MGILDYINNRKAKKEKNKERETQENKKVEAILKRKEFEKSSQAKYADFYQRTTATSSKLGQLDIENLEYSDENGFTGTETRYTVYTEYGPITKRVVECSKISDKGYRQTGSFISCEGWLNSADNGDPGYYNAKVQRRSLTNSVLRESTNYDDFTGIYMNAEGEFKEIDGGVKTSSEDTKAEILRFEDCGSPVKAVQYFDKIIAEAINTHQAGSEDTPTIE